MNREFEVRYKEFQAQDAAWWRLRAEAQAYQASTWPSLRPLLLGPGAVAHTARRTFTTNGIGGVVGIAVSLALGALLVQLIPMGPFSLLLIPLAASLVASALGFVMALVAKPLSWQGQSVTLLWILWESGKKIWDTFSWDEQLVSIVRFLRQRPIPHDIP